MLHLRFKHVPPSPVCYLSLINCFGLDAARKSKFTQKTMISTAQLITQLIAEGGAIISSGECSEIEIADAQATCRFAARGDGVGFVRRHREWLALQKSRETRVKIACNFEDWVRTETDWSTESRDGVYLDIRTAHAFIVWTSRREYQREIIEMKEKVRRLEEQLRDTSCTPCRGSGEGPA